MVVPATAEQHDRVARVFHTGEFAASEDTGPCRAPNTGRAFGLFFHRVAEGSDSNRCSLMPKAAGEPALKA